MWLLASNLTTGNVAVLTLFMGGGVLAIWTNAAVAQLLVSIAQPTSRLRARGAVFKLFYARFVVLLFGFFIAGACSAGLVGILQADSHGTSAPLAQIAIGLIGAIALFLGGIRRVAGFVSEARSAAKRAS